MVLYRLLDCDTVLKKDLIIKKFIFTCKGLHVKISQYKVTSKINVLRESLSEKLRLSLKPVGVIGGTKISDEIENVTYCLIGSELYEH